MVDPMMCLPRRAKTKNTEEMTMKKGFAATMKEVFGFRAGQNVSGFMAELKEVNLR